MFIPGLKMECPHCHQLTDAEILHIHDSTKCSCGYHHGEEYTVTFEFTCEHCAQKVELEFKG